MFLITKTSNRWLLLQRFAHFCLIILVKLALPCKTMFLFYLFLFAVIVSFGAMFTELFCNWLTKSRPMRCNQSEQTRLFLSQSGAKSKPTVTLLCGLVFPRFATVTRTCFEFTVFFRKSHLLDNRRNYWRGPKTLQDVTFRIKEPP